MRNRFWWGDSGSFNLAHLQGLQLFPALLCIVISGYLSVLAQSITQDGPSGVWSDGGPGSVSTGLSRTGKGEKPQKTRPDRCRAAAQRTEGGHRPTSPRPAQKPGDRGWTPSHGPAPRPETSRKTYWEKGGVIVLSRVIGFPGKNENTCCFVLLLILCLQFCLECSFSL